jgi:hypothetical protein
MRTRNFPGDEEALVKVSETDDGTPLLFDPEVGIFWAKVKGQWHSRAALKELVKAVNQAGNRVPVPVHYLYPNNLPSTLCPAKVTGVVPPRPDQPHHRWRTDASMLEAWYIVLLDGDPAADRVRAEMKACVERYDDVIEGFQREWSILLEHARAAALTRERFAEIQKQAKTAKNRERET